MKTRNRIGRAIACGVLSLSMIGVPASVWAATESGVDHSSKRSEQRQEMRAMREKMLADAKAADAELQKLVAQLNKAPESQKPDVEAAILNKLVAQHHQMVSNWESAHAKWQQMREEHAPTGRVAPTPEK